MSKLLTVVMVLCVTAASYGTFYDDWSTYAEGSLLVGQGGWVDNYSRQTTAMPSLKKSGAVEYDGLFFNNGPYATSGAARDISGDVVDGLYEVAVTVRGQEYTNGSALILTIGQSGITDLNPANHLTFIYDSRTDALNLYVHQYDCHI